MRDYGQARYPCLLAGTAQSLHVPYHLDAVNVDDFNVALVLSEGSLDQYLVPNNQGLSREFARNTARKTCVTAQITESLTLGFRHHRRRTPVTGFGGLLSRSAGGAA